MAVAVPVLFFKMSFNMLALTAERAYILGNLQAFSDFLDTKAGANFVSGSCFFFMAISTTVCSAVYILLRLFGYNIGLQKEKLWNPTDVETAVEGLS
ncbi:hypothetical protein [uncultured Chitinophaga sp.]|uniref:hypothetical protein n=1 Tax=uncultured Chitinophaga sp. TaxID=339340 RepID=UPI0026322E99|nr:hypothetical protein [uncultured Chitinophaga sp.]